MPSVPPDTMIDSRLDPLWPPEDDLRCAECDRDQPFAEGRWAVFGSGGFVYPLCAACRVDETERPPVRGFDQQAKALVAGPSNVRLKKGSVYTWYTSGDPARSARPDVARPR